MAVVKFSSGSSVDILSLSNQIVIAIDIGFSKSIKSCGIAWRDSAGKIQSEQLWFGKCIDRVVALIKARPKAVLIIEAPLSALFSKVGNPKPRGDFERIQLITRYWYSGPGAATCLAVVFFLRKLIATIEDLPGGDKPSEVILFEGFISFKVEATKHIADAELLLKLFYDPKSRSAIDIKAKDGEALITITEIVTGEPCGSVAPTIIAPI